MESTNKKPIFKQWWFWVIVIIVVAGIGNALKGNKDAKTTDATPPPATPTDVKLHRVTLEKFNKIQTGMTRDQVEQIINGTEGVNSRTPDGRDLLIYTLGEDMSHSDINATPFVIRYNTYDSSGYAEIAYNSPNDPVKELPTVARKSQAGLK